MADEKLTYTCAGCGETFESTWSDEEAQAEAQAVFEPEELEDAAVVCDHCWRRMREQMPDLDERLREAGR